jgi:hypothetical protein
MPQTIITIESTGFNPNPVTIQAGDTVQWRNATQQEQDASGLTFTTGPIQPGSDSLPIVFDFADPHIAYSSTTGFQGVVVVSDAAAQQVHWPQVRALFTDEDVQHMLPLGLDLGDKADVCSNAADILDRVTRDGAGRMPPPPRAKWSAADVSLLRTWKAQGCPD